MDAPEHVYTIFIRTSPGDLWEALTTAGPMLRYFDERPVTTWAVGSPVEFHRGSGEHDVDGTVLEFDPPLRLSYSWKALWSEDGLREPESRVTWEIEQVLEGVCKLTLVHDRFPAQSAVYKDVGEGWPHILSSLKSLLETGEALPAQPATATAEGA